MNTEPHAFLLPPWGHARWHTASCTPYGLALARELAELAAVDCCSRLARAATRLLLMPATHPKPGGVWWGQLLAAIQDLLAVRRQSG